MFFVLTDLPKILNLHLLNSGTKDVPITVSLFPFNLTSYDFFNERGRRFCLNFHVLK